MNLKELYKKEKGLDVDVEVGGLSVLYYSEDYVKWLESKLNYTHSFKSDSEELCPKCGSDNLELTNNNKNLCNYCENVWV